MFYSWVFSGLNYVAADIEIVKYQKYSNSSKLQLYCDKFPR